MWGPVLWNRPWLLAAGAALGAATAVKWSGLYVIAALGVYLVVDDALTRRKAGIGSGRRMPPPPGHRDLPALRARRRRRLPRVAGRAGCSRTAATIGTPPTPRRATGIWSWVPLPLQSLWVYHQAIYGLHVGLVDAAQLREPRVAVAADAPADVDVLPRVRRRARTAAPGGNGCSEGITSIANPLLWWAGVIAVIYLVLALRREARLARLARADGRRRHLRAVAAVPRADDLPVLHDRDPAVHDPRADRSAPRPRAAARPGGPRHRHDGRRGSSSSPSSWSRPGSIRCGRRCRCRTSSGSGTSTGTAGSSAGPAWVLLESRAACFTLRPGSGMPSAASVALIMTTIGIIGAGHIGSQLARAAVAHGYEVVISNSRGPETLAGLVAELGPKARAGTPQEAAEAADIAVVTVPFKAYAAVPVEPLAGKVVIDTNNYYWERDGQVPALDEGRATVSGLLQEHLPTSRGRQGLQPHPAADITTTAPRGHVRPSCARHFERPRGCRADRHRPVQPVRVRHCQHRPAGGELARRARPAGVRDPPEPR